MITSMDADRELMRTPFLRGGRQLGVGIDCLGVVLHKLAEWGMPVLDPWAEVAAQWRRGELEPGHLMPDGWRLVQDQPRDGDVVFFGTDRLGVGFVEAGMVWTAVEGVGVLRQALHVRPMTQVWRWCP